MLVYILAFALCRVSIFEWRALSHAPRCLCSVGVPIKSRPRCLDIVDPLVERCGVSCKGPEIKREIERDRATGGSLLTKTMGSGAMMEITFGFEIYSVLYLQKPSEINQKTIISENTIQKIRRPFF